MAVTGVIGLCGIGEDPLSLYGVAVLIALVVVHVVVFLSDTLSNGNSQWAGWCVIAFWTMLVAVPVVIMLVMELVTG